MSKKNAAFAPGPPTNTPGEIDPLPSGARETVAVWKLMPPGGWPPDQYTGIGGSYVRDPLTGLRRPADPAPETPDASASVD